MIYRTATTAPVAITPDRPHGSHQARQFAIGAKLHIGCGQRRLAGWVNADAVPGVGDIVLDLQDPQGLPLSTFDIIYGCHVLEHCWAQETPAILKRMFDSLLPGGTLRLSVPDITLAVKNCVESQAYGDWRSALAVIYGGGFSRSTTEPDRHKQIFWHNRLVQLLRAAGFVEIKVWGRGQYPEIDALGDYSTSPQGPDGKSLISLNLEAIRPGGQASVIIRPPECPPDAPAPSRGGCLDISVILGTVNRPQMLRECIESVRSSIADSGLSHEIIVAYGRDDEPALSWMREQGDVVSVLGGMEGAIEAFNRGYAASQGRLICQINDDVLVDGDAIARAAKHLDADPTSAGVVFKFDRGDGQGYRHEWIGGKVGAAPTPHPNQMVVRRETCEAVIERIGAFWGDVKHRTDKTYGGDSAFGVLCRHLGLRLDSVDGVTCRDRCDEARDGLRKANAQTNPGHSRRWRAIYQPLIESPTVQPANDEWPNLYLPRPEMPPRRSPIAAGRPLRLLLLSLQTAQEAQFAQRAALSQIGPTIDISWFPLDAVRERQILEAARRHRPDLVFAQIQSDCWRPAFVDALRHAVGTDCVLVQWTGDVRTSSSQPVERWMIELGQRFDVMLADNTTYPRKLKNDEGVPAACGYLSCGVDLEINAWEPAVTEDAEAVFLGTNYHSLDRGARERLLSHVAHAVRGSLRVYGLGWEDSIVGQIARPFVGPRDAAKIMRRACLTISMSLFHDLGRYSSDRLKRALAVGAVVAARRFPDMEGLGLQPGTNCLAWDTPDELAGMIRQWTTPELASERDNIRLRATALAAERYSWGRCVEELLAIVRDYRARRGLP